eukprot:CAMPEP_0119015542 /NCGR_PEP_ID=MMETSP1176-20130426/11212_1 /TAXON_ID=265551 /ORGANISM="Synedropsis recta cf, Strain CCMP1620" /LENGTH=352 /DNA_ID=CAMNT_0006968847 /DNA_START=53 /DNA_END=1107 /DNA_ORIENTATION=+
MTATRRCYQSLSLIALFQVQQSVGFVPVPSIFTSVKLHNDPNRFSHHASLLQLSATPTLEVTSEDDTVVSLKNPATGQQITLIGTAHLSETSNQQVKSIVTSVKPDVVMIELDRTRLERIGLTVQDLSPNFSTSEDIKPPLRQDDIDAIENPPFWRGFTDFCLDNFAEFARGSITNMYNDIGETMGENGMSGGGEFLAAINAAKSNDESNNDVGPATKIILGDRSSVVTLKRAAELAVRSGNPLGVLGRLSSVNQEELDKMRDGILKDLEEDDIDMKEFNVAMIETMKSDSDFRNRLFSRLEKEVPEFTRSFIIERDYIMAEVIRRETDAKHVVAVVGLAHVPGMSENLRAS